MSSSTEESTTNPVPPPRKKKSGRKIWQTKTREAIVPYLPPPVIKAIGQFDAQLEPSVGPEATVTIGSALFVCWIVVYIVGFLTKRIAGQGRAIAEEDDDNVLSEAAAAMKGEQFDVTVLLCGPMGGGKTRLFYHLCTGDKNVPTLTSLKANVGIAGIQPDRGDKEKVRYIDWPGHASLNDSALDTVWKAPVNSVRLVLVLDATQSVAAAASTLYEIWEGAVTSKRQRNVLICCHKKDFPKAKNWKRIKIQMRTELERLVTTKKPTWWAASKEIELDSLPQLALYFCSTTCESNGLIPLEEYCRQGKLPEQSE